MQAFNGPLYKSQIVSNHSMQNTSLVIPDVPVMLALHARHFLPILTPDLLLHLNKIMLNLLF